MSFSHQSSTTAVANQTTGIALAYPASIAAGDLLIVWLAKGSGAAATTVDPTAAGFTAFGTQTSGNRELACWYKIALGSESGNLTFTFGANARAAAAMSRYTSNGAAPDEHAQGTNTGTTAQCPTATADTTDELCLRAVRADGTAVSISNPSGTQRVNAQDGTAAAGVWLRVVEEIPSSAGAVGTADYTLGASVVWITETALFKEAIVGAPIVYLAMMGGN